VTEIPFEALEGAGLIVGAVYRGGPGTKTGDDPLSRLLGVGNQGGFRKSGNWNHPNFVALYTTEGDPDWPDEIDPVTQQLTYYGDNKKAGVDLLDTALKGNRILKASFERATSDRSGVPPFFVFVKAGQRKDMVFKGLAVPGGPGIDPADALKVVKSWGSDGSFENYEAKFTILDEPEIDRRWLEELRNGERLSEQHCPEAWKIWRDTGVATVGPVASARDAAQLVASVVDGEYPAPTMVDQEIEANSDQVGPYLTDLGTRAFGAENMAVAPGRGNLKAGQEAAGVPGADEAAQWMSSRLEQSSARPAFLFLVGGAGNGKSHLSSTIVEPLQPVDEHDDDSDYRTYRYSTNGADLLLVNDATIGQGTAFARESLVGDLDGALGGCLHAVVNVNRGVLVEELLLEPASGPGMDIVTWLAGRPHSQDSLISEPEDQPITPFIRIAQIDPYGKGPVDLLAVFMDKASLMESRPAMEILDAAGEVEVRPTDTYNVQRFRQRSQEFTEGTPSAELIRKSVGQAPLSGASAEDPISANLESLNLPSYRAGLLSVFRASEIETATRLTYRNLWELLNQAVMGFLCERTDLGEPMDWVEEQRPSRLEERQRRERLDAMLRLAQLRTHQAIYMADCCPLVELNCRVQSDSVIAMGNVDPIRDLLPGGSPTIGDDTSNYGWSNPISEAFAGFEFGGSALEALCEVLEDDDPARLAITEFDLKLDELVVDAQGGDYLQDVDKRRLIRWFASYVTRLYATAHGIPAFRKEVDWWTTTWAFALQTPDGEGPFANEVRTLLFPAHSSFPEHLLLPAFASRVVPITETTMEPTLAKAFRTANAGRRWKVDGDSIILALHGNDRSTELDFDFAVFRELVACRSKRLGATENSQFAEPLLERFRAAMLRPQTQPAPELWVLERDEHHLLRLPK
jgi:hypothetical protein